MDKFEIQIDENGKIIDFLNEEIRLEPNPEELVRQKFLRILHYEYQYPKRTIRREISIYCGSKELTVDGHPKRADIVVYNSEKAAEERDPGQIAFVVECKAPDGVEGYDQLVSYIFNTSANGGVWYNGDSISYFRRLSVPKNELIAWIGIPRYSESWDALGRRKKDCLRRPKDIKGILRRCHNKLYGRGVDGEDEDLTMDMVRIILSKATDEENTSELPDFYCTPEEYNSEEGRKKVAGRICALFEKMKEHNKDVFAKEERITVGPRAICEVVNELQDYRLLSDLYRANDWDIMGYAYEQYTATYLKRQKGQFFTNRLIVDFMVKMLKPSYDDIILDPAGGSGGFLTGAMRYVRKIILEGKGTDISKQRQLDRHRDNLFMVEISKRLVKIAKTAMILNGDGHAGLTQGDSLGDIRNLNERIRISCGFGVPNIILTNPPFAGVGEGKISDPKVLDNFSTGMRWTTRDGAWTKTSELLSDGVPPEMLFFERCLQWLAPGGRTGIVMPKSFLDTQTYFPLRKLILDDYILRAVVNCHKNTFQPHTGVRTCLVFVEKPSNGERPPDNYPIYMAISKRIGQDSEGFPIFRRDEKNTITDEIDHDLSTVFADYELFLDEKLNPSEHRFSIEKKQIDELLRINPQVYMPNINETIRKIQEIEKKGWSVTTLGQIDKKIQIFKGPRLKTENIVVDKNDGAEDLEIYYTPTAILQEKSESAKYIDMKHADKKQLATIANIRVRRGDIVISRSGTIGRVAYITKRLDGAIASDDLIRVRIEDENIRLYVFSYLQTEYAQDQMTKNEYGSVQQHLEPNHIKDILIPMPDSFDEIETVIGVVKSYIEKREGMEDESKNINKNISSMIEKLVQNAVDKR
ncbi:MAG: N-6 DNA methylase [Synergistaceae bacterium]|jgi:type I restriction-modification system DNA methylase subunit|nr:N-6 DNA methylase [Synergistaceae bacterium]